LPRICGRLCRSSCRATFFFKPTATREKGWLSME
jgi:hypothetical protein